MADNCGCFFFSTMSYFPHKNCMINYRNVLEQNAPSWQQHCLFRFLRNWPWVVQIATQSSASQKWPCTATSREPFSPDTCSRRKIFHAMCICMVLRITYLCRNNLTFEFKPTQAHSNTIQTTTVNQLSAIGIWDC